MTTQGFTASSKRNIYYHIRTTTLITSSKRKEEEEGSKGGRKRCFRSKGIKENSQTLWKRTVQANRTGNRRGHSSWGKGSA